MATKKGSSPCLGIIAACGDDKTQLKAIQFMFMLAGQLTLPSPNKTVRIKIQPFCPCCQHVMQLTGIFRPRYPTLNNKDNGFNASELKRILL
uniref:hypothetical protein n=1 Tax=Photobacterium angustum TaxID=661 RepID=UPI000AC49D65|nr:hypothetical protein [Photobacterium angustum]